MTEAAYYIADEIAAVRAVHSNVLSLPYGSLNIKDQLAAQAENILAAHRSGDPAIVFHLSCWCPGLTGLSATQIMSGDLSLPQVQMSMAKEYGYKSWGDITEDDNVDSEFEQAVDWLMHGELSLLTRLVKDDSSLVSRTSAYGHGATLLHYLGANGVETHRQVCPYNAVLLAELLIDQGADVHAIANMYGGSTALALIETSAHPAAAGVTDALVRTLAGKPGQAQG